MGQSTDAQICYGIQVEDDAELPWDEYDGDIEEWWLHKVCGYTNPFEMFDDNGNWIGRKEFPQDKQDEYFQSRREFEATHPLPILLVRHCSGDYPMYIVALESTYLMARRGYPRELELNFYDGNDDTLVEFCREFNIPTVGKTAWWLTSMWW